MKKVLTPFAFKVLLISSFLFSYFEIFSQNYFKFDKSVPLELGRGFDITNLSETKLPLFISNESKFEDDAAETTVFFQEIESEEDFQEKFKLDASLQARLLISKPGIHFGIDEKYFNKDYYKTIALIAKTEFGKKGITNYSLNTEAQKLINDANYKEFIEKYGTHFVQKTNTGLEIVVFISIKKEYFESEEEVNIGGQAKFGVVNAKADYNKAINLAKTNNDFEIQIYTLGPKDALSQISEIIKSSENPIDDIKLTLSDLLKTFTRENSKTLGYFYSPVSLLGVPKDLIKWNETREKNLLDIKEKYWDIVETIEDIKSIKEECYYKNTTNLNKNEFENYLTEYSKYKDSLRSSFNKCLDLSDSYYYSNTFEFSDDNLIEEIENLLTTLYKVVNTKLGTEKKFINNQSQSWNLKNTCLSYGDVIKIDFKSILANIYSSKYTFTAKFDFYINEDLIYTSYIKFSPKSTLNFSEIYEYTKELDEVNFKISVSNVKIVDENGGTNYSLEIPMSDAFLEITIQ